jgi:hypothetical protein
MTKKKDFIELLFFYGFSTQFPKTISKASTLHSTKVLSQENSKLLKLFGGCKKNSFLHFKRYNLAIYVVSSCETFSTNYFNSPKQDPVWKTKKI